MDVFVSVEDTPDANVPLEAQTVLRDLKTALLESVERAMPHVVGSPDPTAALRARLVSEGVAWADGDDWQERAIDAEVAVAEKHRERWVVQTCILLLPGSDCMLSVYENRQNQLRSVLVLRNDMYSSMVGAVHALTWVLSPPDAQDRFYVLEAHTYPWPSSRWRSFAYRAFAPGLTPDQPVFLGGGSGSGDWMNGFVLDAKDERFSIKFNVWSDRGPDFEAEATHEWKRKGSRFVPVTAGVNTLSSAGAWPAKTSAAR